METVKNAANYVSESVKGTSSEASKEANKNVAKDNDASLGSRATAAKDAVGDKFDEVGHNNKADVHKGKHNPFPSTCYWFAANSILIELPNTEAAKN